MKGVKKLRVACKRKLAKIQEKRLLASMTSMSKTDELLLHNFTFDGEMKRYLKILPFSEARVVFMVRSKMFPGKENFKGRWSSQNCEYCDQLESTKNLFACPGCMDLLGRLRYEAIFSENAKVGE